MATIDELVEKLLTCFSYRKNEFDKKRKELTSVHFEKWAKDFEKDLLNKNGIIKIDRGLSLTDSFSQNLTVLDVTRSTIYKHVLFFETKAKGRCITFEFNYKGSYKNIDVSVPYALFLDVSDIKKADMLKRGDQVNVTGEVTIKKVADSILIDFSPNTKFEKA